MSDHQTGIAIYEEATVIQALRNQLGNIKLAAMELNVERKELITYMANHPDVLEARRQIREGLIDDLEDVLFQQAKTDNTLLMFVMKTQAADRGYGNKSHTTHTGPDGKPIEIKVTARTMIAAFQRGIDLMKEEEEEQEEQEDYVEAEYKEVSNLLPQFPV